MKYLINIDKQYSDRLNITIQMWNILIFCIRNIEKYSFTSLQPQSIIKVKYNKFISILL